jgi:hypothetical protein
MTKPSEEDTEICLGFCWANGWDCTRRHCAGPKKERLIFDTRTRCRAKPDGYRKLDPLYRYLTLPLLLPYYGVTAALVTVRSLADTPLTADKLVRVHTSQLDFFGTQKPAANFADRSLSIGSTSNRIII